MHVERTTPAKAALIVSLRGQRIELLNAENFDAAGGRLLDDELPEFERLAKQLARSFDLRLKRTKYEPPRRLFFDLFTNNPWSVCLAAFASVVVIVYYLSSLPALPILAAFSVAGLGAGNYFSRSPLRWLGALVAISGVVTLFATVGLYADRVETPWETPATLRWASGFLIFFGGGLFIASPKPVSSDEA